MTYSPTRFAGMSCSSSGQRRQLRPRPLTTTSQPGRREEAPAAAGVGGSSADAADVAADVVADVAAAAEAACGRSFPDTGNQCTG